MSTRSCLFSGRPRRDSFVQCRKDMEGAGRQASAHDNNRLVRQRRGAGPVVNEPVFVGRRRRTFDEVVYWVQRSSCPASFAGGLPQLVRPFPHDRLGWRDMASNSGGGSLPGLAWQTLALFPAGAPGCRNLGHPLESGCAVVTECQGTHFGCVHHRDTLPCVQAAGWIGNRPHAVRGQRHKNPESTPSRVRPSFSRAPFQPTDGSLMRKEVLYIPT
ncbi:hypothetical protein MSAN_02532900 [Mycena sanguinolenta]|uniref:Uncharacterized protein n=1 Tax=Mycena sanguinolenta TaxID=230812 RepID=A0A8H6WRA3_9AGAR|nr:hypothetical protein MSAN_02532900 [Mycena sanguinolenta]